jgi:hypothetical protein
MMSGFLGAKSFASFTNAAHDERFRGSDARATELLGSIDCHRHRTRELGSRAVGWFFTHLPNSRVAGKL